MILITSILIVVFSAVFFYNSAQIKDINDRTLEQTLEFTNQEMPFQFYLEGQNGSSESGSYTFAINVDSKGKVNLLSNNVLIDQETLKEIAEKAVDKKESEGLIKDNKYQVRYLKDKDPDGYNIAFVDVSSELTNQRNMLITCIMAWILSVAVFFLVSFFLSRWVLKPVEKSWESQKRFAADASHELRTPLTVILANMDILKSNRNDKIADRIEWVDNTEAEAKRMKALANNLLFLTRNGEMKKSQAKDKVNLSDLTAKVGLAFEPIAFENNLAIESSIGKDIFVGGDEEQLRQLLSILLDNAVKYSYKETTIRISLDSSNGKAILKVQNTGVPIVPEEQESIFERFYRSDKSRAKEGYGLGLSIAKNIADMHKATINAKSDPNGGTIFTVTFPIYK
jgi:signal transduction histidine kinase